VTSQPEALAVRTDRALIRPTHHSARYVVAEITGPPATTGRRRPPASIAFVLDRSGSMGGEKIRLVKEAVRQGIDRLAPDDRFAVVVYDDVIDVVAPSAMATPDARRRAFEALSAIDARGTTALAEGWLRGAEQVAANLASDGVNRVLLLTDGLANVGITDPLELERHARELRARGVSTSTFGVGRDFDERLLQAMADAGAGAFRYIETAAQIPDHIAGEVGEVLEVTVRDVALVVTSPDRVQVEAVTPYPVESGGSTRTLLRLGDLVADQALRLVLRLRFPLGESGREAAAKFELVGRDGPLEGGAGTLTWTYAPNAANDDQPRDVTVDRVVARTYADRALRDVVHWNREGEFDRARQELQAVARRIRGYAGSDPELRAIVDELEREAEAWSRERLELERKMTYASAHYSMHMRAADGMALRRPRS
jgi:Ca-activated chloride channel family protein